MYFGQKPMCTIGKCAEDKHNTTKNIKFSCNNNFAWIVKALTPSVKMLLLRLEQQKLITQKSNRRKKSHFKPFTNGYYFTFTWILYVVLFIISSFFC